ncbi:hypothetical protein SRM1_02360 [Pseudomonas fluorescens]|nr:hypothetical protein SRM1_02360 [Pseudomonas fluorescens]
MANHAAQLRQVEDVAFHLADDVHLARLAVELQRQHFIAVDQLHRRDFGAHAGHAFGLFRAQVEGETQTMLGDHHRHFACFFVRFVRGVDQLHAVTMIEVARFLVVDVGEERQVRIRVHRWRRGFGFAAAARMSGDAGGGQRFDHFTAQGFELRVRDEECLWRIEFDVGGVVLRGAELAEQIAQLLQCLLRFVGNAKRTVQGDAGADAFFTGGGDIQLLFTQTRSPAQGDATLGRGFLQRLLPVVIEVTIQRVVRTQFVQAFRHFVRLDAVAVTLLAVFFELAFWFGDVGAETDHFTLDQYVQTVAVGQRFVGHDLHVTLADFLDRAHRQTGKGRRIEGADVDLAISHEVIGAAAVEGFFRIGHEEVRGAAAGSAGQVRAIFEHVVEALTVIGGDVLHVAHVFVATFDLERAHTGFDQGADVGALVVVLHRQQVFLVGDHATLFIFKGIRQATGLGAIATVGATPGLRVGNVALTGERHAQRTVNEELDGGVGFIGDRADFLQIEFASQHQLREAGLIEELRPFKRTNVGLGRGVQLDRRNVQLHHAQILDDQCIDTGVVQLMDQLARRLQFVVVQDRVDGGENARMIFAGEFHQLSDLAHFVAGVMAGAEAWATNVHGVGAVQDRLAGNGHVAGRAEQFQMMLGQGHSFF